MNDSMSGARGLCAMLLAFLAAGVVAEEPALEPDSSAYQGPVALAVTSDGASLLAACADARQVLWLELPGGRIVRKAAMPAEPTGLVLSPDGAKLFVTCAAPRSTVAVLDTATGETLASLPAGHTAMGPAVSPDGKRLYVCNRFNNDVSVIDLATGTEAARVAVVREPVAACVSPDGQSVLVANHLPNTRTDAALQGEVAPVVTVIDAKTLDTSSIALPHGASSLRSIRISPDGRHALVTHLLSNFQEIPFRVDMGWINTNVVSILDLGKRRFVSTIGMDHQDLGAGNPWDVAWTADGKRVCVSLAGTHELAVIDLETLLSRSARVMMPMMRVWPIYPSLDQSKWRRVSLPGNGPRGLAVHGSKVYAAEFFSDTVAVVDLAASEAAVQSIPLGPSPQMSQVRLGQRLFHDAMHCHQRWQTCASCHPDGRIDGLNWDLMNDGSGNPKNTKSLLLAHQTPPSMSEGVRETAEEAVRSGFRHILFREATEEEAVAVDAYLKSLRPVPSPRLIDGRLSPAAERGRKLFESPRIGCFTCHPAPHYTDLRSHNVGSRVANEAANEFDTPTLVEIWRTAPYLHDGRYTTIKDLLNDGRHGLGNKNLSPQEIDDLAEFVLSL